MAVTVDQIFVNLPVKDLEKSKAFFSAIGFEFNAQFTDENAACLIISQHIYAMLLVEPFFESFISKKIADASQTTEVILALSATSRAQVDELVNKALQAGGLAYNDPVDHGFMYSWSFQDVDHHLWEIVYMEPSHVEGQEEAAEA
ncbi:putative lactoylglutathione lyase [Paenibacillus phyllosphaerae]|uniref:Putative lactoylglutathione lyase n=1 Tax=Paenibacillus phyllosphaerae TaxID=274593 RepID=A0A7W5AWS1_9BACL|nr:VOC family protein [Paenibacillus phyllosphaerae]MBB3110238.1 putative lactoylglutathione lyase [Paenibacillus phyllosphaerae]